MQALGDTIGRYRLVALLGEGGMGRVYRARDDELGRFVAVKVVSPRVEADGAWQARLVREARTVAALSHPNIVTVFDAGTEDGAPFIVMELLDGETLRRRIERGPLTPSDVIELGIQIAEGLAAAHHQGLVHRDLKPENIFLTRDGRAKIVDFGLARSVRPATGDARTLTEPGRAMGTSGYMAPEQARGEEVGVGADVFALGCVLFELCAGTGPFHRKTPADMVAAILTEAPPVHRLAGTKVPPTLVAIISKCLEKAPSDRYQSARDVAAALRAAATESRLVRSRPSLPWSRRVRFALAATAAIAAAIVGAFRVWPRSDRALDSLAILPFAATTAGPEIDYLSDGLAEDLINELSRTPGLRVVPRATVFRFRGDDVDPQKVGRELGVKAVVAGRVGLRGDEIIVQMDLIDVGARAQLWGERFVRPMGEAVTVTHEMARTIATKLQIALSPSEAQRLTRRPTDSADAYELYLKGLYNWNRFTPDGWQRAVEFHSQAIEKDASFAGAHAGLSDAYFAQGFFGVAPPRAMMPLAKSAAGRAVSLDPGSAHALLSRAVVRFYYDWDRDGAGADIDASLVANPNYAQAHQMRSYYLAALGRFDEAIVSMKRAKSLDPLSLVINADLGLVYAYARRDEEAVESLEQAQALDPTYARTLTWLTFAYEQTGRHERAVGIMQQRYRSGGTPAVADAIGAVFRAKGLRGVLELRLERFLEAAKTRYVQPYDIAVAYAQVGEMDRAFDWLERSLEARAPPMAQLTVEPLLRSLHGDPRFASLVTRVGVQSFDGIRATQTTP